MKYADLHLHTVFSDGTYTPKELVTRSIAAGLSSIAVADHDTVMGLEATINCAENTGLEVLSGIELSSEYENTEVHILGYLIDYERQELIDALSRLKKRRIERIYIIVDKLKKLGVTLDPEAVFELAKQGTVGRLHVARAMVKEGLVSSLAEAFKTYIGDKCPAYVLGFRLSPYEAAKLITESGGIPVLAHPYTIPQDGLILKIIESGIRGLEVYYPEHTQSMVNYFLALAQKHHLLVTGGSDCHGIAKPEVKIGSIKIPYDLVEKLKESKSKSKL